MLTVSHAVSGAFIAAALPNPLIYIPLTLIVHYWEDSVAHWDVGTGMKKIGARSLGKTFALSILDALLGILAVALIWRQTPSHFDVHIWLGAFFCLLPDLLNLPHLFLKKDFRFMRSLEKFHEFVHFSTQNIWLGLLPQAILILVIFFIAQP